MNMKKVKEKLSSPWIAFALNLLLLIVFLALVTVHIKMTIDVAPVFKSDDPLPRGDPDQKPATIDSETQTVDEPRNVCESPECITLAHELHNYKDPSVDPCQDFYQHFCGKFYEHSAIGQGRMATKRSTLSKLIREFLLKNKTSTSKSENTMKQVYAKCRELQKISDLNSIPPQALLDIFSDIKKIGAWPVLDKDWDGSKFNLNEMLRQLVNLGETHLGFFHFDFIARPYVLIKPPLKQGVQKSVLEKVVKMILEANEIKMDQGFSEDLDEYFELSNRIKIDKLPRTSRSIVGLLPDVRRINFRGLILEMMPRSKMNRFLGTLFQKVVTYHHPLFVRDNETNHLDTIIRSTSNRALANYLIFNFIHSSIKFLTFGLKSDRERCEKIVVQELPRPSLRVFMRNCVDKGNREEVAKLTETVKENVLEMIRESDSFTPSVKKRVLKKVEAIGAIIGYPDHFDPPGTLDKEYENLTLDASDSYYKMSQKLHQLRLQHQMEFLAGQTPLSPSDQVLEVNAHYDSKDNALTVLAPFLDDPFFDSTYPEYVNLIFTGFLIGHEFGHSIDPKILRRDGWYKTEDMTEYGKRAQCLIDQYDNYDDPDHGKQMNGTYCIGEIVGDWVGRDVTWRAFKKMDLSKMQKLIGFEDKNLDQLYFRIQSLFFCGPRSMKSLEQLLSDPHPTEVFRVNGIYSNMPQFAKAFNCPIGSPMNPEKKCKMF